MTDTEMWAGGLSARIDAVGEGWTVWAGAHRVGVLTPRRVDGQAWLTGRLQLVDHDLVAEGPTVLSVLRRLSRQVPAEEVQRTPRELPRTA